MELATICADQSMPLLIGGDFNLLRSASDKNKSIRSMRWSDAFNGIINTHEMREIDMSGGQYTWSNNQAIPTLEKLDRFLMNKRWEMLFPLATVHKITREMSDHNPIIIDTMEGREKRRNDFRFEKVG